MIDRDMIDRDMIDEEAIEQFGRELDGLSEAELAARALEEDEGDEDDDAAVPTASPAPF